MIKKPVSQIPITVIKDQRVMKGTFLYRHCNHSKYRARRDTFFLC